MNEQVYEFKNTINGRTALYGSLSALYDTHGPLLYKGRQLSLQQLQYHMRNSGANGSRSLRGTMFKIVQKQIHRSKHDTRD